MNCNFRLSTTHIDERQLYSLGSSEALCESPRNPVLGSSPLFNHPRNFSFNVTGFCLYKQRSQADDEWIRTRQQGRPNGLKVHKAFRLSRFSRNGQNIWTRRRQAGDQTQTGCLNFTQLKENTDAGDVLHYTHCAMFNGTQANCRCKEGVKKLTRNELFCVLPSVVFLNTQIQKDISSKSLTPLFLGSVATVSS